MKNKRYRVWMMQGFVVEIDAKKIEVVSVNDKPVKIRFVTDEDYLVAEFYCERINGWAEVGCLVDYVK